jgi:hypothetical protein
VRIDALLRNSSASEQEGTDRIVREVAASPEFRALVMRILGKSDNA